MAQKSPKNLPKNPPKKQKSANNIFAAFCDQILGRGKKCAWVGAMFCQPGGLVMNGLCLADVYALDDGEGLNQRESNLLQYLNELGHWNGLCFYPEWSTIKDQEQKTGHS